jgi:hypothetical protein
MGILKDFIDNKTGIEMTDIFTHINFLSLEHLESYSKDIIRHYGFTFVKTNRYNTKVNDDILTAYMHFKDDSMGKLLLILYYESKGENIIVKKVFSIII